MSNALWKAQANLTPQIGRLRSRSPLTDRFPARLSRRTADGLSGKPFDHPRGDYSALGWGGGHLLSLTKWRRFPGTNNNVLRQITPRNASKGIKRHGENGCFQIKSRYGGSTLYLHVHQQNLVAIEGNLGKNVSNPRGGGESMWNSYFE